MKQKGFSAIILLITCAIVFVAAAAGAYYYLKFTGKSLYESTVTNEVGKTSGEASEISVANDSETLKKELDKTTIDSIDADLRNLDTQASSL